GGDGVLPVEGRARAAGENGDEGHRGGAAGVGVEGVAGRGGAEVDLGVRDHVRGRAAVVLRLHGGDRRTGAGDDRLGGGGEDQLGGGLGGDRLRLGAGV